MTNTAAEAHGTDALPGDTFHVRATPGGGWWGITIDELEAVFAQARRYGDVEAEARSAIAFWFDVDQSQVGEVLVTATESPGS